MMHKLNLCPRPHRPSSPAASSPAASLAASLAAARFSSRFSEASLKVVMLTGIYSRQAPCTTQDLSQCCHPPLMLSDLYRSACSRLLSCLATSVQSLRNSLPAVHALAKFVSTRSMVVVVVVVLAFLVFLLASAASKLRC